jgi:hypothetical protein
MALEMDIKIVIIPIIPNSVGLKILAKTIPTIKVIPELAKLSIKLHFRPCIPFSFKDVLSIP